MPAGSSLLDVSRKAGLSLDADCGGQGVCGQCLLRLISGDVAVDAGASLSKEQSERGYVLACAARLKDGPVVVEVPAPAERGRGQFAEVERYWKLVAPARMPSEHQRDPLVSRHGLTVDEPGAESGQSDLDRLVSAITGRGICSEVSVSLPTLQQLAECLRAQAGAVTVTLAHPSGRGRAIAIEAGHHSTDHTGIAIDVGTTTIAVQLVLLPRGVIADTATDYNDQIACGLDVISRINYARAPGHLDELRRRALTTINRLIAQLAQAQKVDPRKIYSASLSGNTTMVHLLLGLNPEYIRLEPYVPTAYALPVLSAGELGIDIAAAAPVHISPGVGSYLGGDITAGLLCSELVDAADRISLFMDIGTNGEIVVGNREFLVGCACSAGPAFEGGGISCGMRASEGAIDRVKIDRETGVARYSTIGAVPVRGICGSGIISLLAELFLSGWLDPAGRLERDRHSEAIDVAGRRARYLLVPAHRSAKGEPIWVSELDIENLIRAKAAVYSACALMFAQLGISDQQIDAVYIAGGFGRFLDLESAITIGLLPDLPRDRFQYLGNGSLMGSYLTLVSRSHRDLQRRTARRLTYLELNTAPEYMDQYTAALFLPHTDQTRFPSVERTPKKQG
jgi:uncharacterized 2Fe-2S/4Fe-4S cluster protein (DUF4445 family)